jgi:hypothetical protein
LTSEAHTDAQAASSQPKHAPDTEFSGPKLNHQQGNQFQIRIAPKRKKYADLWTAQDILSFLSDPTLKSTYLRCGSISDQKICIVTF